ALYMSGQGPAAFELMCSLPNAAVNFSDVFAHPRRYRLGLQGACQRIMKNGPLRWVSDDGTDVAEIKDWKTLRARISEAQRRGSSLEWNECPTATELWQGPKLLRGKGPRVLNGRFFGHEWVVE